MCMAILRTLQRHPRKIMSINESININILIQYLIGTVPT